MIRPVISVDSQTEIVPDGPAYRLRQRGGAGGAARLSLDSYTTTALALKALVTDTVRWGNWK